MTVVATTAAPATGSAARRWAPAVLLLAAPVGLLVVLVGYPLVTLLQASVDTPQGWSTYGDLWGSEVIRTVLARTLVTAGLVSAVCLLLGYPYAYLMTAAGPGLRTLLLVLVLLPFWTSFTIRTLAWVVLLQDQGLVNDALAGLGMGRLSLIRNTTGVVIGMAHVLLPYAVLSLYAVMRRIDRRLLDAAAMCGARRRAAFFQVYLPLTIPGVVVAVVLVFILSLGFFVAPQLLGSSRNALLSQLIYTDVTQLGDKAGAAALGMTLLAVTVILLLLVAAVGLLLPKGTKKAVVR
jgi:putative spermidine/putrescine transport system permease protein